MDLRDLDEIPRRIIAEDLDYNLPDVPTLKQLAVRYFVAHYEIAVDLSKWPVDAFIQYIEELPRQLRITNAVNIVPNYYERVRNIYVRDYWEDRCKLHERVWKAGVYGPYWRCQCAERYIEIHIERFVPKESNMKIFMIKCDRLKDYVTHLVITELQPEQTEYVLPSSDNANMVTEAEWQYNFLVEEQNHIDFSKFLPYFPHLKTFYVSYQVKKMGMDFDRRKLTFSNKDALTLGQGVRWSPRILDFELSRSNMDSRRLIILLDNIKLDKALHKLSFQHNDIDGPGMDDISNYLADPNCIWTHLNLENNAIDEKGAVYLAERICLNKTLKVLNLGQNKIRTRGAVALCRKLACHKTLRKLNLSANRIDKHAIDAICELIRDNKVLQLLNLSSNKFDIKAGTKLKEAIWFNGYLLELDLRRCGLSDVEQVEIQRQVRKNRDDLVAKDIGLDSILDFERL